MNTEAISILGCALLMSLAGCSITPPPVSVAADDPSNPAAAESGTRPPRPALVAGVRNFLPTSTGADAQKMQHSGHDLKLDTPAKVGEPHNQAEQEVAAELKSEPSPAEPTGQQLQSIHPADYTCPMHPEIHSHKPGSCPKCGMPLVTRASLKKAKR